MNPPSHPPRLDSPPVFNCVVHVAKEGEQVIARVANLAGIEFLARTEREAISQVVTAFKARVAAHFAAKEAIPWIKPPALPAGASERLVAIHL